MKKKGYTYLTNDGVYFDSSKFKDYTKLAKLNIEGLKEGKRIQKGDKKNKTDFALWKFSGNEKRQQEWDSPWGKGFPGWHIECSAMSIKYLGEHFDIHTGGEDHIPIHHTNEIAQSEAATGKKFVNYWLHGAFLLFKGEKVSKSKGGLYTISDLEELGYSPLHFRYLCLLTHYRKPLNFTLENLDAAKNAHERLKRKIIKIKQEEHKGRDLTKKYESLFSKSINDDLNLPEAIQVTWKILDDFNFSPKKKIKLLEKIDQVLGLKINEIEETTVLTPPEVEKLIEARERFRKNKMWEEADILRERIKEKGYSIKDNPDGTTSIEKA